MRSRSDYGEPGETVVAEKRRRVRRAATAWLAKNPALAGLEISFEVIALGSGGIERIRDVRF
jgi:Holliday junction resolvase-like predicted endonuclease